MATNKIQIEDHNGDIYYPHTSADVVKRGTSTVDADLKSVENKFNSQGAALGAVKLATARKINGVSFDGTKDVIVEDNTKVAKTGDTMTGDLNVPNINVGGTGRFGGKIQSTRAENIEILADGNLGGGFEANRGTGRLRMAPSNTTDGSLRFESFNNLNTRFVHLVMEGTSFYPGDNGRVQLGYSGSRWSETWCTRGAFNGSDISLKENVKKVLRSEDVIPTGEKSASEVESKLNSNIFYNYVKNSRVYTFNYKNTEDNFVGIIANEIPNDVFKKFGVLSKTEAEYQEELLKKKKYKEIFDSCVVPYKVEISEDGAVRLSNEIDYDGTIIDGTEFTYRELETEATRTIEKPVRLINAPAQIAMLQEVLSIALNKIEILENKLAQLQP